MDDTPAINDGADTSLRKTVSLLNKIEAKTGSTTITGPVTVSNEVEVKNDSGNPVPVNDAGGSLTVDGSVSVSNLPASYPVTDNGGSLTVDGTVGISGTVPVSGTFWQATQPVSGTVTAEQATAANLNATVVQGTATNLKTQAESYQGGSAVSATNALYVRTGNSLGGQPMVSVGFDGAGGPLRVGSSIGSALPVSLQYTSANSTAIKVDGSAVTQPISGTVGISGTVPVSGTFWQATQPISGTVTATQATAANLNATVVGSGSFTAQQATAANLNATVVQGTATNLKTQAETYQGGSAVSSSNPLLVSLANTSANATAVKVDGSSVTQPTRETQPIGDYVINTGAYSSFSLSGSVFSTASFDAGVGADYVVLALDGGGPSGGLYIDGSIDGSNWISGSSLYVYYDTPAISSTDSYGYRTVLGQLFGNTRASYGARFIVNCNQSSAGYNVTYRYFRITSPATYGSWRYRFVSFKSIVNSISAANSGSVARVNGRVDVGCVTTLPTLSATVTQSTATNLRTQAENYQGGTAVGSANPLQVTLANTAANATAIKVDGSAVTQPVSGTITVSQATAANLNATVSQNTHANLKAQAQILDSSGNQLTYAATGTAGTPASDVVTVQGIASGTAVAIRPRHAAVSVVTGSTADTNSNSVLSQNTTRQYLLFQNLSDTDMNINFGAAASSSTMLIPKNGGGIVFETGLVPTDAVNLICTAASKAYYILHA